MRVWHTCVHSSRPKDILLYPNAIYGLGSGIRTIAGQSKRLPPEEDPLAAINHDLLAEKFSLLIPLANHVSHGQSYKWENICSSVTLRC